MRHTRSRPHLYLLSFCLPRPSALTVCDIIQLGGTAVTFNENAACPPNRGSLVRGPNAALSLGAGRQITPTSTRTRRLDESVCVVASPSTCHCMHQVSDDEMLDPSP